MKASQLAMAFTQRWMEKLIILKDIDMAESRSGEEGLTAEDLSCGATSINQISLAFRYILLSLKMPGAQPVISPFTAGWGGWGVASVGMFD